jgi:hypothetical protein
MLKMIDKNKKTLHQNDKIQIVLNYYLIGVFGVR